MPTWLITWLPLYLVIGFVVAFIEVEEKEEQRKKENKPAQSWTDSLFTIIIVMIFFPLILLIRKVR